jgi:hypothetical protein
MFFKWHKKQLKKMANDMIDLHNEILDDNQQKLTKIANQSAEINSEAITKSAKALKKEFKDTVFCKHCGESIDSDSKFCKKCGKEQ